MVGQFGFEFIKGKRLSYIQRLAVAQYSPAIAKNFYYQN